MRAITRWAWIRSLDLGWDEVMNSKAVSGIIAILTGVIGISILAVLVSKQSQTPQVLQAAAQGFGSILNAATGPVSGGLGGLNNLSSSIL
jgi:hypothetical protein